MTAVDWSVSRFVVDIDDESAWQPSPSEQLSRRWAVAKTTAASITIQASSHFPEKRARRARCNRASDGLAAARGERRQAVPLGATNAPREALRIPLARRGRGGASSSAER